MIFVSHNDGINQLKMVLFIYKTY